MRRMACGARLVALTAALALLACVDSSTGTSGDTSGTGAASNDPSGNWNATQFTLTSTANANQTADLVLTGKAVSVTVSTTGALTSAGTDLLANGRFLVTGNDVTWKGADSTVQATGTFSRTNNQMTLDLSGKGIVYDFNGDAIKETASLHAILVSIAH